MSKNNGNKSRAGIERKKKMLRRKHTQELRKAMEISPTGAEVAGPGEAETRPSLAVRAVDQE